MTVGFMTLPLSKQEIRVLGLLAEGFNDNEIADALGIGWETVRSYLKRSRVKLTNAGYETQTRIRLMIAFQAEMTKADAEAAKEAELV